jgi:hypothetical protein
MALEGRRIVTGHDAAGYQWTTRVRRQPSSGRASWSPTTSLKTAEVRVRPCPGATAYSVHFDLLQRDDDTPILGLVFQDGSSVGITVWH